MRGSAMPSQPQYGPVRPVWWSPFATDVVNACLRLIYPDPPAKGFPGIAPLDHGELAPIARTGKCPCGCIWFYEGPHRGHSVDLECASCYSRFTITVIDGEVLMVHRRANPCWSVGPPPRGNPRGPDWKVQAFRLNPSNVSAIDNMKIG